MRAENLQKEIVDLAHCGHQGMTRTKQLLREKVWFTGIDRIAEEKVKTCFPCQALTPQNTRKPIQVALTNRPWDQVSCDFADVGNGEYIMIIIDNFTPTKRSYHSRLSQRRKEYTKWTRFLADSEILTF